MVSFIALSRIRVIYSIKGLLVVPQVYGGRHHYSNPLLYREFSSDVSVVHSTLYCAILE